jgi:tetratricopeptide (TPR) repeat protein
MARKREKRFDQRKQQVEHPAPPFALPCKGWQAAIACAVIAAAAFLAYHNSFSGEMFYDNRKIIADNPIVKADDSTAKIFSSNYWSPGPSNLYRPLPIYTYYLNYKMMGWEARPAGYHVCNLILHIVNGMLVFLLLSRLSGRALVGAFAGILFVAHPVLTEDVTNIVGRADLMAMFFVLLAFLLHMAAGVSSKPRRFAFLAVGAFLFFLGLLSKESAIAGVAMFLAFDLVLLWPRVRRTTAGARGIFRWLLTRLCSCHVFYLVPIAAWVVIRSIIIARDESTYLVAFVANPLAFASFLQREATAIVVLGLYLVRLVWPVTLSADYSYDQIPLVTSPANLAFLASLAAVLAVLALGVILWKKSPLASFLIWCFFICIAPVCNIFLPIGTIAAERLLYMPSLAWCGLLAVAVVWLAGRLKSRRLAVVAAVAVILCIAGLYSYRTIVRNEDWRTEKSFFAATYATSPRSVAAIGWYADTITQENPEKAMKLVEDGFAINSQDMGILPVYGNVCIALGQKTEATDLEKARKIYLDGYRKIEDMMTQDTWLLREIRRRLAARGIDVSGLVMQNQVEMDTKQIRLAELAADTYEKEKNWDRYRYYYEVALAKAKQTALVRAGGTANPLPHMAIANELQRIAASLPDNDPERLKLLEQAATSCMRAYFLDPQRQFSLKMLRDSYSAMGLNPDDLVPENKQTRQYYILPGKVVNEKYKRLAARSQIMIEKAAGGEKGMETLVNRAVGFGVRRADLEPLLSQSFSRSDERIWTGE